jgi:hypothetical protein
MRARVSRPFDKGVFVSPKCTVGRQIEICGWHRFRPILAHVGARKSGPGLRHGLVRAMCHVVGQIRFWAKDSLSLKNFSFWAEVFSVLGQASISELGQNSDKNI